MTMDMTLRRISAADADKGFRHVVSGFSGERGGVESECFLGREWEVLERILLAQGPEEVGELPITMGDLLGDDDLGTACFYLPPDEVAVAARFLVAIDTERSVAEHADGISGTFRHGDVPDGYPEILGRYLEKVRDLYTAADRAGEGVANLVRG
ncbi:hypothetical protein ACGF5O_00125 [Streptomyces sp. NPDC048291]|uniref:hypothetical protein n=1 Tax=Streptomyces sp. NPDC048291 TaxID=3365530 RepID=UPI00371C90B1